MYITYEGIKKNETINTYIRQADENLKALGFTEHSFAHVCKVAETAGAILAELGFDEKTIELGKIAGYMHDIGNVVNRIDHAQSGAVMSFRILDKIDISRVMEYFEIFLGRMSLCKKAADKLGYEFKLVINHQEMV